MKLLNDILNNVPEFGQLLAAMDSGRCPVALSGLSAVHRAHFAAGVYARTGRPVVLVCADEGEGERLARDLESLTGQRVPVLAPRSYIFHNAATVSRQWEHRRLALMRAMVAGEVPLMVAAVASVAGVIAFLGLIAPHIAFLLLGRRGGPYLPLCALMGGAILLAADLLARGFSQRTELPLSIWTVLFGAPVLTALLLRGREESL